MPDVGPLGAQPCVAPGRCADLVPRPPHPHPGPRPTPCSWRCRSCGRAARSATLRPTWRSTSTTSTAGASEWCSRDAVAVGWRDWLAVRGWACARVARSQTRPALSRGNPCTRMVWPGRPALHQPATLSTRCPAALHPPPTPPQRLAARPPNGLFAAGCQRRAGCVQRGSISVGGARKEVCGSDVRVWRLHPPTHPASHPAPHPTPTRLGPGRQAAAPQEPVQPRAPVGGGGAAPPLPAAARLRPAAQALPAAAAAAQRPGLGCRLMLQAGVAPAWTSQPACTQLTPTLHPGLLHSCVPGRSGTDCIDFLMPAGASGISQTYIKKKHGRVAGRRCCCWPAM